MQVYDSGEEVRWVGAEDSDQPAARVRTFSIDGEGGQLATLAALQQEGEALRTRSTLALGLGILALLTSVAALVIGIRRRPPAPTEDVVISVQDAETPV